MALEATLFAGGAADGIGHAPKCDTEHRAISGFGPDEIAPAGGA